jgi:glutamate dehydrogenase
MTLPIEKHKQEHIGRVLKVVEENLSGARAGNADFFIREFYRDVPPGDVLCEEPETLCGSALSLELFGERRKLGKAKVRAFNPKVENDGWRSGHTIVEIVNEDMPFLVDSVTMALNQLDLTVHVIIHPTFVVKRDKAGRTVGFTTGTESGKGAVRESFMHVQVSEQTSKSALKEIEKTILNVLSDVRSAVEDWRLMLFEVGSAIDELKVAPKMIQRAEVEEAIDFLAWARENHFTFLGSREYKLAGRKATAHLEIVPGTGKGILRNDDVLVFEGLRDAENVTAEIEIFLRQPIPLLVTKSNLRSTIHRPVHIDTIAVKRFNAKGKVTGEFLFAGLFTSVAYSLSPRDIPYLRRKVNAAMELSGFEAGSHSGKAFMHVLENYPRDELFQIKPEELHAISRGVVNLQERQRTALFVRHDPFDRFVSTFVYTPRDRYTQVIRRSFGEILSTAFKGRVSAYYTHFTDEALGRLQYIVSLDGKGVPAYDISEIEAQLQEATRTWSDRLLDTLISAVGEERGNALFRKYGDVFPAAYREDTTPHASVFDIKRFEKISKTGEFDLDPYQQRHASDSEFRVRLYSSGSPVLLSDALPVLEKMGLIVASENPYELHFDDAGNVMFIHDFGVHLRNGTKIEFDKVRLPFKECFASVWRGEMENDGFNELVLAAGLSWRQVVILRAYSKYLRQARIPFSQEYMEQTLAANGAITRGLVEIFEATFNPKQKSDGGRKVKSIRRRIETELEKVSNLDEDRIIRSFLKLVETTLRTNFYQFDPNGEPISYLSLKFSSREIEDLPKPRPLREIFVYSPRFEAVHLRFGLVARGGLRWSDRREDFRTEVLGLAKAQQVKNGVIVPVGSKGGFVLKKAPPMSDRDAYMAEGVECYKLFVGAMLEITDNLKGDKIVAPRNVVRRDDPDPYLVVAADKGTATFSDFANGVAREKGFWLDDAFASGGSAGYDHKKMGITAKGAWESVKRHFREMGHDTQTEEFTAVGCGDMSGDVFGNGMLLSEQIKLLGAFNHLHIIVDPDPDPENSYKERKRLFDLPRSSWIDYDPKLISKGGGLFERSAKSIKLTREIKQTFGIERDTVTPNELIRSILLAHVDLLWFGGIGTYIKAASESDADAGDRANDPIRVNGGELNCKVVGEGANLGATQRGRVEFAMAGGRLNTDFIDNSAGVDCSDHEVNIKIVFGDVVQRGDMTMKQRDKLLMKMTDEVGTLVLRDNYQQSQAITTAEAVSLRLLDRQNRFMRSLEREGLLDREIEFLPDEEEVARRLSANVGMTRPEISILLSYAKIVTYDEILASDLPDEELLAEDLLLYFPTPLRNAYRDSIMRHKLRREIIATMVTNSMINRVGATYIHEMHDATGYASDVIARAYLISRDAFELRKIWNGIEALDNKVDSKLQTAMLQETNKLGQRNVQWFLRNESQPMNITRTMDEFAAGIRELHANIDVIAGEADKVAMKSREASLSSEGVPQKLAKEIAKLNVLASACDIVRIANALKQKVTKVGAVYFGVGSCLSVDWLKNAAISLTPENEWQKRALDAVVDDLFAHQSALTQRVLDMRGNTRPPEKLIEQWIIGRGAAATRVRELVGDLRAADSLDISMLAVANRELRNLVGD